ncbi:glutathione peroxidase [[Clostridium] fimetarium]|uniref:Glutathione peroxidase n=1 Tax=[Clostridium] fimetarium TaxID=99656 RepID=A0A1I0RMW7_9FIRM|nr:glutathione peroxidase [[Clostridium] fimetarium]SEW42436.1 glutathione peroxidase [[Clostridium] fimetarium]
MNIYDLELKGLKGKIIPMKEYEGKVLLIVNTATGCGFTPQYEGLQKLYDKYQDKGFEILDFPCNQFGHQAPGNDEEIHDFCQLRYKTSFPRFTKIDVNGKNADPLFKYLKKNSESTLGTTIKWNFTKFLVDREGNVVKRYAPTTEPIDIDAKIAELLQK